MLTINGNGDTIMAEKTGAGGKPQKYDENSGRYGESGGDIRKAVDNYKPNDLKSTVDRYKELERKYNDDLTAEPPKHKQNYSKSVDSAVMNKYSSVRKKVDKFGFTIIKVNDGKNFYIVRINKSDNDFDYDILKVWKIND